MKLYSLKDAPNPRRVRIFLAEKRANVTVEEFDMDTRGHRQPAFLERNPLGTLPVLELDTGELIGESVAICRHFEEMLPEPPLFGRSSRERVEVEMWNRRMEHELLLPVSMFSCIPTISGWAVGPRCRPTATCAGTRSSSACAGWMAS